MGGGEGDGEGVMRGRREGGEEGVGRNCQRHCYYHISSLSWTYRVNGERLKLIVKDYNSVREGGICITNWSFSKTP